MADDTLDETLKRLAQSGVATHVLSFEEVLSAAASLDDEVQALETLSALTPGPIYRVAPLRYAFEWREDADALAATLAEKLGLDQPPVITALEGAPPAQADAEPRRAADALTMLGAFSAPGGAGQNAARVVIDAAQAVAAAETTAARIDELMAELAARMPGPDGDAATAERLAGIEAALTALSETARVAPDDDAALLPARIDALSEAIEALPDRLGAPAAADPAAAEALAALTARHDAAAQEIAEAMARLEAAVAARAPDAGIAAPTDPALLERLERIEAALAAAPAMDMGALETLAQKQDALAETLARLEGAPAAAPDPRLDDALKQLATLTARPAPDMRVEREGLTRLSSALQTMLSRMDGEITRLLDAQGAQAAPDVAGALAALEARLAGLETAIGPAPDLSGLDVLRAGVDALGDRLAALEDRIAAPAADAGALDAVLAELRALNARPVPTVDLKVEREGLARLSSTLQTTLSQMDAAAARLTATPEAGSLGPRLDAIAAQLSDLSLRAGDDGVSDAVLQQLRALADRPIGADLRRERETLTRLSFSLQTVASRLEAEVSRLMDADLRDPAPDLGAALAPVMAGVGEVAARLDGIESASGLTADHAASLVDMVQRVREECAELHGLHGRYIEAQANDGPDAAEAMMDQISATMAEFLARLERAEAQRAGGLKPAARLGRAS